MSNGTKFVNKKRATHSFAAVSILSLSSNSTTFPCVSIDQSHVLGMFLSEGCKQYANMLQQESQSIWLDIVSNANLTIKIRHKPRSTLNMLIESPCATPYLPAVVMLALPVAISKINAVGMCMTLKLSFRMGGGPT